MKKTTLVTAFYAVTCGYSFCQKTEKTPSSVTQAFAKKFPKVSKVKWEKEDSDYEAEFYINKVETSAVFDSNGKFKEEESEMETSKLPNSVREYCSKNYKDHKLTEASKITTASGEVKYEAELSKGKSHFDLIFDSKGNLISKEK